MQLLRLLADGRFHSGEELGIRLGVSRSAVWKQLQQLQADSGIALYSVRGKGYRLERPLSLLSVECLSELAPGLNFLVEERVDSTNAVALRELQHHEPPFIVLAESQSAGRGRRGRQWVSPYGENLYFSQVIRIDSAAMQLQALSLVVGLAVLRTLVAFGAANVALKWPNDLLVGGRKVAGILLELSGDPADVCHVVMGIGVNVNMRSSAGIEQEWTSIALETGRQVDRNELAATLGRQLEEMLSQHRKQGFAAFHAEWERHHAWQGREVRLINGVREIVGSVLGVTGDGCLRLAIDGGEQAFNGGELSLRLKHDS